MCCVCVCVYVCVFKFANYLHGSKNYSKEMKLSVAYPGCFFFEAVM